MKHNLLIAVFSITVIFSQTTTSYSWEDGGTILGYYGNIGEASVSVNQVHSGSYSLYINENPEGGTPQAYVAYIEYLTDGDIITASVWIFDDNTTTGSGRIWAHYANSGDVESYAGSASGNSTYSNGLGWDQLSYSWTFDSNGGQRDALVIEVRIYSNTDGTSLYVDDLELTAPAGAVITDPSISGLTANAGEDQFVLPNTSVTLDGTASSGDIIAYLWEQTSGITVTLSGAETAIATFTAPAGGGTMTFQLTVYDNEGASDVDDMNVSVCSETTIAAARSLGTGQCVTVEGVVISPNFQSANSEYAIQDATAGLVVFGPELNLGVNYGDLIQVSGMTDEYNGKFEVIVESLESVVNLGPSTIPTPQVITVSELTANGEEYESELIAINNVTVVSGDWPADGISANLEITDDGSSLVTMRIDSDTDIDGSAEPTWPVDVTGVGGQYDYSAPYDGGYQILPRFLSDFEETGGNQLPTADAGADQTVDPGVLVTLDGSASFDPDGTIVGYLWEQTAGPTVALSDYEEPVVTFTSPNESASLTFQLTVVDNQAAVGIDFVSVFVIGGAIAIYDVQYATDPGTGNDCYPSTYLGDIVTVSGVVTAVRSFSTYPNFYIQDPDATEWGGIYVYVTSDFETLSLGDEIIISAEVDEYYGFTELKNVASYAVNSSGNVVNPIDITTGELAGGCSVSGEALEGMLVRVSNVTVTAEPDEYSQWYVDDGSGACQIDDFMFEGSSPSPTLGEQFESIVGVVDYSFDEYGIQPRNAIDLGGGEITPVSIYDIQFTTTMGTGNDCYPSPMVGENVITTGLVTAVKASGNPRFYIQENANPWSGIYVYDATVNPSVGDEITLTASVDEYFGLTELQNVSEHTINSSGNAVTSVNISTGDLGLGCSESGEAYESLLVTVSNMTVDSVDAFGGWYVDDGTGTCKIDDYFFDGEMPVVNAGDVLSSITGAVEYGFGEYAILPRNIADIVTGAQETQVTVDHRAEWNLVSLPLDVADGSFWVIYPGSIEGTLISFDGGYQNETMLIPGEGYWLRFADAGVNVVSGTAMTSLSVSLSTGWNLLGSITSEFDVPGIVDPEGIIVPGTIYGFSGSYFSASTIIPGKGYWINANADGNITLTTGAAAKTGITFVDRTMGANKISFNGATLYFGVKIPEAERQSYVLPPKPPLGAFDVRFTGNMKVVENTGNIEVMSNTDKLSVDYKIVEIPGDHRRWVLVSDSGTEYELAGSGRFEVFGNVSNFMLNKKTEIPSVYSISQNFPNPFNPVTTINYELPVESFVTIAVYNLRGQKISNLVNDVRSAGYHQTMWEGTNFAGESVASGVYIYTITASNFRAVKKMILIR